MFDWVSNPAHYSGDGDVSCMRAMASMMHDIELESPVSYYWWGCALKYVWRWAQKGGEQDLDKAIQCLGYLKESEYGKGNDGR